MERFKAILLLVISALLFVAALLMVLLNLGNETQIHLYIETFTYGTGLTLLLAAVAGILLWAILKRSLPAGIRLLRSSGQVRRQKATEQRLKELEKVEREQKRNPKPDAPAATETAKAGEANPTGGDDAEGGL